MKVNRTVQCLTKLMRIKNIDVTEFEYVNEFIQLGTKLTSRREVNKHRGKTQQG